MANEDYISREQAINEIEEWADGFEEGEYFSGKSVADAIRACGGIVAELPSVQPKLKTDWIPVSERMPEICEKDVHGDVTYSKMVLSCRRYGNGFVYVGNDQYTTNDNGAWLSELVPFDGPDECCKVVAWMPLPEPYKESEEI